MLAFRPLKIPLLLALSSALLLAGCVSQPQEVTPGGTTEAPAPVAVADPVLTEFTGTVLAPNPAAFNPVMGGTLVEGQEGVHYQQHKITLTENIEAITIKLTWTATSTPAAAVPDLDMLVFDPENAQVAELSSTSSGAEEIGAIEKNASKILKPGEYTIRVINFAGANVAYKVEVETVDRLAAAPAA